MFETPAVQSRPVELKLDPARNACHRGEQLLRARLQPAFVILQGQVENFSLRDGLFAEGKAARCNGEGHRQGEPALPQLGFSSQKRQALWQDVGDGPAYGRQFSGKQLLQGEWSRFVIRGRRNWLCAFSEEWFSVIQCLLKSSFESLHILFMEFVGILGIWKRDYVALPGPFPCFEPLLNAFDELCSWRIRLLHDIHPVDASKIGFFKF